MREREIEREREGGRERERERERGREREERQRKRESLLQGAVLLRRPRLLARNRVEPDRPGHRVNCPESRVIGIARYRNRALNRAESRGIAARAGAKDDSEVVPDPRPPSHPAGLHRPARSRAKRPRGPHRAGPKPARAASARGRTAIPARRAAPRPGNARDPRASSRDSARAFRAARGGPLRVCGPVRLRSPSPTQMRARRRAGAFREARPGIRNQAGSAAGLADDPQCLLRGFFGPGPGPGFGIRQALSLRSAPAARPLIRPGEPSESHRPTALRGRFGRPGPSRARGGQSRRRPLSGRQLKQWSTGCGGLGWGKSPFGKAHVSPTAARAQNLGRSGRRPGSQTAGRRRAGRCPS